MSSLLCLNIHKKGKTLILFLFVLLHWSFESLVGFHASTDFVVHKEVFYCEKKEEKSYIFKYKLLFILLTKKKCCLFFEVSFMLYMSLDSYI